METARQREAASLALRAAGATYAEIGRQLGIAETNARQAYIRALSKLPGTADRGELRRLEAMRLDRLQLGFWARACSGDAEAAGVVISVMQRRARLLGLDELRRDIVVDLLRSLIRELETLPQADLLAVLGYEPQPALSEGEGDDGRRED
jgi:hypothetical protein